MVKNAPHNTRTMKNKSARMGKVQSFTCQARVHVQVKKQQRSVGRMA